ncbi:hypothetical protein PENTCL1PPCAC_18749, partial [Pristionchus entomophagus]
SILVVSLGEFDLLIEGMLDGVLDDQRLVLALKSEGYEYLDLLIGRSWNLLSDREKYSITTRILHDDLLFGHGRRPLIDQTSLKAGSTPSEEENRSPGET